MKISDFRFHDHFVVVLFIESPHHVILSSHLRVDSLFGGHVTHLCVCVCVYLCVCVCVCVRALIAWLCKASFICVSSNVISCPP